MKLVTFWEIMIPVFGLALLNFFYFYSYGNFGPGSLLPAMLVGFFFWCLLIVIVGYKRAKRLGFAKKQPSPKQ